jgi:hypothetical protein
MSPRSNEQVCDFATDRHAMAAGPAPGIIGALLQALNGSGDFRIVDLGGELFLEPCAPRLPPAPGREVELPVPGLKTGAGAATAGP